MNYFIKSLERASRQQKIELIYFWLMSDELFWKEFQEFQLTYASHYPEDLESLALFNIIYWALLLEDEERSLHEVLALFN